MRKIWAPIGLGIVLVAAWWAAVAGGAPSFMLPDPLLVLQRLGTDLTTPLWWQEAATTLVEAVGGCVLGGVAAYALALLIHLFPLAGDAVHPFLGALQAVPAIAIAPLLVLWIGYGVGAVVVLCALMVFFPILVSTLSGLRHVDRELVDAGRIDGASRLQRLFQLEAPLALPSTLAGLRTGFTLSVTGAVVGEMVMGGTGLGSLLTVRRDAVDTAGMFAVIFVLCVVAMTIYGLLRWWEHSSRVIQSLR